MAKLRKIGVDIEIHRVIESGRLSFSETENDILRRMLLTSNMAEPKAIKDARPKLHRSRERGVWTAKLGQLVVESVNMLDAYERLLRSLSEKYPDFLDKFAMRKGRSRRYIARDARELYQKAPHLADTHARILVPGWFFDTNLSEQQIATRVREAVECAGLRYGLDASISNGGREL